MNPKSFWQNQYFPGKIWVSVGVGLSSSLLLNCYDTVIISPSLLLRKRVFLSLYWGLYGQVHMYVKFNRALCGFNLWICENSLFVELNFFLETSGCCNKLKYLLSDIVLVASCALLNGSLTIRLRCKLYSLNQISWFLVITIYPSSNRSPIEGLEKSSWYTAKLWGKTRSFFFIVLRHTGYFSFSLLFHYDNPSVIS